MKNIILTSQFLLFLVSFNLFSVSLDDVLIKREIQSIRDSQIPNVDLPKNSFIDKNTFLSTDSLKFFNKEKQKNVLNSKKVNSPNDIDHYGYNYFYDFNDRLLLNNQPPLADYKIGPGDELIIEIWGDINLKSNYLVDKYGKINIDKIGQVYLTGLNPENIEQKLIGKFIKVYSTLGGTKPSSFLDISLGKLKSINISFIGELESPGIHPLNSHSTIITSLIQIGGVKKSGTLRDIQVLRSGTVVTSFDFYKFLNSTGIDGDIRLLDGDVIYVPVRLSTITCIGSVHRPGIYELLPNETIDDMQNYFGGIKSNAKSSIRLHRLTDRNLPAKTHILNLESSSNFILKDGDELEVFDLEPNKHVVFLYGQVKSPGEYPFNTEKEVRLLDILKIAGFLDDPTYLNTVYKDVGEIIRNYPNTNYPKIIKFNLGELINGEMDENIILKNWDIVLIRENPNYKFPSKVSILGEVNVPGIYSIQKKQETLNDVLNRAGGFTEEAFELGLKLYRQESQIALYNFSIPLLDGDSILVPEHPGIVKIIGEVNRPGIAQYNRKKSFKNYIENAGGFTINADKYNITIIYANGDVRVKNKFKRVVVTEGSTIIVNSEEVSEKLSFTEFSTNVASLITSFATLFLLVNQN